MSNAAPWTDRAWRPGPADTPALTLVVWGVPGTAGSKSAFPIYKGTGDERHFTGRVAVVQDDKSGRNRSWRAAVRETASQALVVEGGKLRAGFPLDEALTVDMIFTVVKPASAPKARRTFPVARPDVLKYARAVEDELQSAGVLRDDARVVDYGRLSKVYPGEDLDALDSPGAVIRIWRKLGLFGTAINDAARRCDALGGHNFGADDRCIRTGCGASRDAAPQPLF